MADENASVVTASIDEPTQADLLGNHRNENDQAECKTADEDKLPSTLTGSTVDSTNGICSDDSNSADGDGKPCARETVELKIIYNKQKYDVTFALDDTVDALKQYIEKLTDVPVAMQKIMFKGRMNDDATLRDSKVTNGAKIMVIGSTVNDVLAINEPSSKSPKQAEVFDTTPSKEPLCKQKAHKTVLDKYGKPDDIMPGIRAQREPLPPHPISGMYNKMGGKVRLTFKLEAGQVWIGTKERTEKLSLGSVKSVISEPIEGHDEYHLMALQLGPTEASRYWVYWVPAQYVDAIKDAILGSWQYF
jgi:hypothetical protein